MSKFFDELMESAQQMDTYLNLNRANWDERAPLHAVSVDYATARFIADPGFLSTVVRFDQSRLGDIRGLRGLHLQCHIGTDTLSLARLGAVMTGLDFSGASLEQARRLASACNTAINYIEAPVYEALQNLDGKSFDLIYTGIGALNWLPRIDEWAKNVAGLLHPGGRLFLREGHPMLMAVDEDCQDQLSINRPYFERPEPMIWDDDDTYVKVDAAIKSSTTHEWNHGLGEVISALLRHGLNLVAMEEHDSIPWEALPGQMTLGNDGEWRLKSEPWRLPLSYTLQAVKR